MSSTLHIGTTSDGEPFTLPPEAATRTFGVLAVRGAGKSNAAVVLAEELFQAGLHWLTIDPKGDWWGIRSSKDGAGPGLPIVIFGGRHADLPLEPGAGAQVAELVVDMALSCILDLSEFTEGEKIRFLAGAGREDGFAARLYRRKSEEQPPTHLFLEEADDYLPQKAMHERAKLLHDCSRLVLWGRSRGIGATVITQRSARLHKDVLTQIDTLIALRTTAPQDRSAIQAWVDYHALSKELVNSLPALANGEAWVWSPEWLKCVERIQFRQRATFDSGATPGPGKRSERRPASLADIDLGALRERLAATIERAKQDDPRELRRQIAELHKQLRERAAEATVEHIEVPILSDEQIGRIEILIEELSAVSAQFATIAQDLAAALARVAAPPPARRTDVPQIKLPLAPKSRPARPAASAPPREPPPGDLTRPQQRILDALAEFEAFGLRAVARHNLAIWSDQSPRSSGFTNNLGRLRTLGLIDYPEAGQVALTQTGRVCATPAAPITTIQQLHTAWYAKLPNPQARIVRVLVERYPQPIERVALAEAVGQSLTSSGYTNNLGALRSLGLLDYPQPGWVVATDLLFPNPKE